MAGIFKSSGKFFRNVVTEMKRVSWPTRGELLKYTTIVIATVVILAIFFALIDLGISELLRLITK